MFWCAWTEPLNICQYNKTCPFLCLLILCRLLILCDCECDCKLIFFAVYKLLVVLIIKPVTYKGTVKRRHVQQWKYSLLW